MVRSTDSDTMRRGRRASSGGGWPGDNVLSSLAPPTRVFHARALHSHVCYARVYYARVCYDCLAGGHRRLSVGLGCPVPPDVMTVSGEAGGQP
jgi:hypothetical protein